MGKFSLILLLIHLITPRAGGEEINFLYMKQSGYELLDILASAESFSQETGIRVNCVFVEYEDRYDLILQSAGRSKPEFDLILLDLIWTADFAQRRIIDSLPQRLERKVKAGIIPQIYTAFEYRDRLWAIPFHTDFQIFYTNMDLLSQAGFSAPPHTLEEMLRMARMVKEMGIKKYPIFESWRKQEVLICEFVWLAGAFGGSLTDEQGNIDCTNPPCQKALTFMTDLLRSGLMNPYSLESEENFTSEVFQAGDCLFTTNWAYLIRLLEESGQSRNMNWMLSPIPASESVSPGGTRTSSVCGFEGLAVLSGSNQKEAAWSFAEYLASPEFQSEHLEFMPVWKEVWNREETHRNDPRFGIKLQQIAGLQYRPVHTQYRRISSILQNWIFQALIGEVSPAEALREAQTQIDRLTDQQS